MPFGIAKVNILLHGLFFMRKNGDNLEVLAPKIPGHHFIGGVRGTRQELSGTQDLTGIGLAGKIDNGLGAPSLDDIDGSIMQFPLSAVTDFTPDPAKFLGKIALPWPMKFGSLRTGDIDVHFQPVPGSKIGQAIVDNATSKGRDSLGVVTLLQYTLPAGASRSDASQLNIHFYLQPRDPHKTDDVNKDLEAAAECFVNPAGFDLRMQDPKNKNILPPPPKGNLSLGTTAEDEQSIDEELNQSPDIGLICANDPPLKNTPLNPKTGQPNVSPANCPILFIRG